MFIVIHSSDTLPSHAFSSMDTGLKSSCHDRQCVVDDKIERGRQQQGRNNVVEALSAKNLHIAHQLRQGNDDRKGRIL